MYSLLRNQLFRMDPEQAHEWTIRGLQQAQRFPFVLKTLQRRMEVEDPRLKVSFSRIRFPNPVGLAAGFDKHAQVYPALAALGFGFVEVGTLTPRRQSGNPRPRLYRLPEDQAVINRMGFNNGGVEQARSLLSTFPRPGIPIGINLGKNKQTPQEEAASDYRHGLRALYRHGDYFAINISSPNTRGLRDLQQSKPLEKLLSLIMAERDEMKDETGETRPVFLKLAPDLTQDQMTEAVQVGMELDIDGFIVCNTTLSREGLKNPLKKEEGGMSGKPLAPLSTKMIRHLYRISEGRMPIIGVGGIFTGDDAYEKIRAGACLIQVYTGMIYRGPSIAREINRELLHRLEKDGYDHISEAVGQDA
ncbi:quinone-dependent dihydroorotate dehydrogenase [Paludifilum halophilum]|uniref:Dihydroorotate dehydrogenase (quinone) n=1 Tax=Paludifilum halophilum TaxID=1642702 RepID=A0A235B7D3_9BACL|nr:quinone-dependent dihydroorotate dehydrogenase [Paludifilum halophilum]OYD08214.1 dihydroorotate dehydrogenase (quinone) [Paludifilum halophilum]